MENASKALLMAAGVLIGVLILSLAVFLFANFGSASAEIHKQKDMNDLNEFNTQFTSYEGQACTIHDIITVANLAKDNNTNYSLTSQTGNNYYITVKKDGEAGLEKITKKRATELIKEDSNNLVSYKEDDTQEAQKSLPRYTCKTIINPTTQKVQEVNFSKIKD